MPRIARKQSKVRMNLDMPEPVKKRLEDLRNETYADSLSEVIRRALALYDLVWTEKQQGSTTIIRCKDGTEKQIQLL